MAEYLQKRDTYAKEMADPVRTQRWQLIKVISGDIAQVSCKTSKDVKDRVMDVMRALKGVNNSTSSSGDILIKM